MDISELSRYPISGTFIFDNSRSLELVWDGNYFKRSNIRAFDKAREVARDEARKPHLERLALLTAELAEMKKEAEKKRGKKRADADLKADSRAREIENEAEEILDAVEPAVEQAERQAHARELADKVLISWDMLKEGEAAPLTAETLEPRPVLFLRDLYEFCREESVPKSLRTARTRASLATSEITNDGLSDRRTHQPADRIM